MAKGAFAGRRGGTMGRGRGGDGQGRESVSVRVYEVREHKRQTKESKQI